MSEEQEARIREVRQRMLDSGRWPRKASGAPKPTGTSDEEWLTSRQNQEGHQSEEGETGSIGGMDFVVIHSYTLDQAIDDGTLVPLFLDEGEYPTDGKRVVATSHLLDEIGVEATLKVWDNFQGWKRDVMPMLPEEDQLYAPTVNGSELFVIEDAIAYTLMLREDY